VSAKSYDGENLIVKDLNLTFARNSSPCSGRPARQDHQPDDAAGLKRRLQ
jgi:hypothetical protein